MLSLGYTNTIPAQAAAEKVVCPQIKTTPNSPELQISICKLSFRNKNIANIIPCKSKAPRTVGSKVIGTSHNI
jgi:hypothetical protein